MKLSPEHRHTLEEFSKDTGGFRVDKHGAVQLAEAITAVLAILDRLDNAKTMFRRSDKLPDLDVLASKASQLAHAHTGLGELLEQLAPGEACRQARTISIDLHVLAFHLLEHANRGDEAVQVVLDHARAARAARGSTPFSAERPFACPGCGQPALEGMITCGTAACGTNAER